MPYLDIFTQPLTTRTAAHLLRRATFGPTQSEIAAFIGKAPAQAVQSLITNANYSPQPIVDLDKTKPTAGQQYMYGPFEGDRNADFGIYLKYWWLGLMTQQNDKPNLLDKLTLFWQNHFVTARPVVDDYRFVNRYLLLLRNNALGNFRTLVTEITKDPAMLRYLNGNENEVGSPNENYARELQELFTVGAVDAVGNKNYTEDDVKAAARVLTGWKYTNWWARGSTSFNTVYMPDKHDAIDKQFSSKYAATIIRGRSTATGGDEELADLIAMLLRHPQTPRFICRKLYRWYVNSNVTPEIETNVIAPLADFFASATNNFAVRPVIEKLLTSQIFFDERNIGAMIKSPADLLIGSLRLFNQPVPILPTDYDAFKNLFNFVEFRTQDLQMNILEQPSVFGYEAYYQTNYSEVWLNTSTVALRGNLTDWFIWRGLEVKPGYNMGIDVLAWATALQADFSNIQSTSNPGGTLPITCVEVLTAFTKNMFVNDLFQTQKDFLIDSIMMQGIPRRSWEFEWNAYRATPNDINKSSAVTYRLMTLMRYLLRMAEYQVF
jgi:uncharacterized protein (DUF1800 family)